MALSVIINEHAGTVQKRGQAFVRKEVETHLGERLGQIDILPPEQISQTLGQLAASGDDILIGGGDGTISAAAHQLYPQKVPFGVLPMGTMNLFARDLGIAPDLTEALQQYRERKIRKVDVGCVNHRLFVCNAILGVVPRATTAREKARRSRSIMPWPNVLAAMLQGFSEKRRKKLELQWESKTQRRQANAVIVSHNCYVREPHTPTDRLRKESMTCGRLYIYLAKPASSLATVRLLFRILNGKWQNDPAIDEFETEELEINLPGDKVLLTVDGEVLSMDLPLHFSIVPRALPVIVPASTCDED